VKTARSAVESPRENGGCALFHPVT
jgi:hypothetical protein